MGIRRDERDKWNGAPEPPKALGLALTRGLSAGQRRFCNSFQKNYPRGL
jgi:hypothetical protein